MDSSFSEKTLGDIFEEIYFNTKTKRYPDGSTTTCYCNKYIFTDKEKLNEYSEDIERLQAEIDNKFQEELEKQGYISSENEKNDKQNENTENEQKKIKRQNINGEERSDSIKRARDKVFDIARLNEWKYFITITFNGSEYEFKDPQFVAKKLRDWLRNRAKRNGLKYLLIPEYHKKGGIHCHAFINDVLQVVDSGTRLVEGYNKPVKLDTVSRKNLKVRNIVYNIPDWKYGFSTAIEVDNNVAFSYYITKYITKGNKKIFGNYYWSGGGVVREPEYIYTNSNFNDISSRVFGRERSSTHYKYQTNSFFIPDFDKLANEFDDIGSFLNYIYSDEYKRRYSEYADNANQTT